MLTLREHMLSDDTRARHAGDVSQALVGCVSVAFSGPSPFLTTAGNRGTRLIIVADLSSLRERHNPSDELELLAGRFTVESAGGSLQNETTGQCRVAPRRPYGRRDESVRLRRGGEMRKYQAVIFDLWGTLVDELNYPEESRHMYQQKTYEMADVLGADRDDLAREWSSRAMQRIAGVFPTGEAVLQDICGSLGIEPSYDCIRASVRVRLEYIRDALSPRLGVVETLSILRKSGYRVGLISNCGDEASRLWALTQLAPMFDAVVLLFEVGLTKPDVRIYELAAQRLGVSSTRN